MYYFSVVFVVGFCLCIGLFLRSKTRRSKDAEREMFSDELNKIKSDSVINFIDADFLRRSFEFFGNSRFIVAANDEGHICYPITNLQDLDPKDLA